MRREHALVNPIDAAGRAVESVRALLRNDAARALEAAQNALVQHPAVAELHALAGHAARVVNRPTLAESSLRRALELDPRLDEASASLAHHLRNQGRYEAAAQVMAGAARLGHDDALGLLARIDFLRQCARSDLALDACGSAAVACSMHAGLSYAEAELLLASGRFDAARAALLRTLTLDPEHAGALLRLSQSGRFESSTDPELAPLHAALANPATAPQSRVAAEFALGRIADENSEFAVAVRHFERGNRAWRAAHPWDAAAFEDLVEQRVAWLAKRAPPAVTNGNALLLLGLPRSGTTLLASQLGTHPQVRLRGELNWLAALASQWRRRAADAEVAIDLAARYRAHLQRDDAPALWYIDKNPLNFRELDCASLLAPGLRIVHCRRDLRDTALSLWTQHFAHPDLGFAYGFGDIAQFAHGYRRIMRAAAGAELPMIESRYEDLVRDPETERARILAWLGLDPAERVDGIPSADAARSASVYQVRQRITDASIGRWRRYAEWLPELAARFEGG
jgi:tetratricopeptide (TPR) repeat protein